MISTQTTESMKRVELLDPKRWNLPNNERHRLAIYFSKNCVDWCFAALLADAGDDGHRVLSAGYGKHEPTMVPAKVRSIFRDRFATTGRLCWRQLAQKDPACRDRRLR